MWPLISFSSTDYFYIRGSPLIIPKIGGRDWVNEIQTLVKKESVNKIRTKGKEGAKIRTSFMDVPLDRFQSHFGEPFPFLL